MVAVSLVAVLSEFETAQNNPIVYREESPVAIDFNVELEILEVPLTPLLCEVIYVSGGISNAIENGAYFVWEYEGREEITNFPVFRTDPQDSQKTHEVRLTLYWRGDAISHTVTRNLWPFDLPNRKPPFPQDHPYWWIQHDPSSI